MVLSPTLLPVKGGVGDDPLGGNVQLEINVQDADNDGTMGAHDAMTVQTVVASGPPEATAIRTQVAQEEVPRLILQITIGLLRGIFPDRSMTVPDR